MREASVILCTYNRASMLGGAIESLAAQTIPPATFEVLVVDNNSSDGTADAVMELRERFPELALRYLLETMQGLGRARNAGWRASEGKVVAFLDDDARAAPDWLEKALAAFSETAPAPWAVGGPIRPYYDSPRPSWFRDEYEERNWGARRRPLESGESFAGSNLVVSRDALERFGGFSTEAGMTGSRLSVGEETALILRIWESGEGEGRLLYLPDLVVRHHVPGWKMTVGYQLRRAYAEGQNDFRLRAAGSLRSIVRYRFWAFRNVLSGTGRALARRGSYSCRESWMVETLRPVWSAIGSLGIGSPPRAR